jgi:hypothetical protein
MSYCTESNFEIAPGLWTHNYTVNEVAGMEQYGCCQKFVCSIACPAVRVRGQRLVHASTVGQRWSTHAHATLHTHTLATCQLCFDPVQRVDSLIHFCAACPADCGQDWAECVLGSAVHRGSSGNDCGRHHHWLCHHQG